MRIRDWSSVVCSSDLVYTRGCTLGSCLTTIGLTDVIVLFLVRVPISPLGQRTISSKRSCSTRRRRVPRRMRSAFLRCSRIGGRRLSQVGREGGTLSCCRLSAHIGRRPADGRRSCYAC